MPLNLSALIRYKTINNCLSSLRSYTIQELVDRCSAALTEYKGMPTSVSERTLREDIKNMKSDLLGFRAPIEVRNGRYFYEDRNYDLLNVFIRDEQLALELIQVLIEIDQQVSHPKIHELVKKLNEIITTTGPIEFESDWLVIESASEMYSPYETEIDIPEPERQPADQAQETKEKEEEAEQKQEVSKERTFDKIDFGTCHYFDDEDEMKKEEGIQGTINMDSFRLASERNALNMQEIYQLLTTFKGKLK